ncbi:MAG: hypothetical protein HYY95_07545 [Candidatus Rokubacteria bacterium]|nr:hypothetical protein [Candidatus Rokubacteria bacterium]
MKRGLAILIGLMVALGASLGGVSPAAASHEIVIGLQCDRTGATQVVGVNWCPGYHDYVALVNSKGGKFVKATEWFKAYPDVLSKHIKEAGAKK